MVNLRKRYRPKPPSPGNPIQRGKYKGKRRGQPKNVVPIDGDLMECPVCLDVFDASDLSQVFDHMHKGEAAAPRSGPSNEP